MLEDDLMWMALCDYLGSRVEEIGSKEGSGWEKNIGMDTAVLDGEMQRRMFIEIYDRWHNDEWTSCSHHIGT